MWSLLTATCHDWYEDRAKRLGAALAYYTIFALTPGLVIVMALAGLLLGPGAESQIIEQFRELIGKQGAGAIEATIQSARKETLGAAGTALALLPLVIGLWGVFGELQDGLNTIWGVTPKPGRRIRDVVKERFLSFAMVVGIGFLLLVSLVLSAWLAAVSTYVGTLLPAPVAVLEGVNFVISFVVITGSFALIFKLLPDVKVAWRDVWLGAAVTSPFFTVGKSLIGFYTLPSLAPLSRCNANGNPLHCWGPPKPSLSAEVNFTNDKGEPGATRRTCSTTPRPRTRRHRAEGEPQANGAAAPRTKARERSRVNRRSFLGGLGLLLTAPLFAEAQRVGKIPRVAFITATSPENSPSAETFRQGLGNLGYVEGQNIVIEWRWGRGKTDRFPEFAVEVSRIPVDVIVAGNSPAGFAAKSATRTIPIVIATMVDPVGDGFVAALARPGGNITGLALTTPEITSKRLQLLKEAIPAVSRVAFLADTSGGGYKQTRQAVDAAARSSRAAMGRSRPARWQPKQASPRA
jgi:YihY family inner membrane protein